MKYLKTLLAAAMVLAVTLTTGEARADSNSEDRKSTRIAEVNPDLPEALLETLPSSILDEDIWVDPTLPPGTPFVEITPGGDLRAALGQSAKQQREANELLSDKRLMARCTTGIVLPASVRNKRIESTCPAVIGWNNEATVTYTVVKRCNACYPLTYKARGYTRKRVNIARPPLKPQYIDKYTESWHAPALAGSRVTVPWGKVAAKPAIIATNTGVINGWSGFFYY